MATIHDPWPKRSFPNGHPADGMTLEVSVGDGAYMSILDPRSFEDGGLCWTLTWGDADAVRYVAASVISSYDYLLCGEINMAEATRRLRLMRAIRRQAVALAGEARRAETEGLGSRASDGEAGTPSSTPHPQSPSLSEVEEAKAVLAELDPIFSPELWIAELRHRALDTDIIGGLSAAKRALARADRIEAALATLTASQEQDGEVRT